MNQGNQAELEKKYVRKEQERVTPCHIDTGCNLTPSEVNDFL
jgi:hypothetical protein